jgi:Leucine-rich repeat (LRR) protein
MNPEFDNLLRLLSSTDEPNVRLGLQIARNYTTEIEAHFGYSLQDLQALFEFLVQYEAWNFATAFWEIMYLDLSNREIIEFPKIIVLLSKLIDLDLAENHIEIIPSEIGLLQKLKYLYLSHNRLQILPIEIELLQNLEMLSLEANQFRFVATKVGKLAKLRMLGLNDNPLQSLPEELCNLKNTKIHIRGTPKNMYIPEKLKEMGTLIYE